MPRVRQNRAARHNHIVEFTLAGRQDEIDPTARMNFLRDYRADDYFAHPEWTLVPFRALPIPDAATLRYARRYPSTQEGRAAGSLALQRVRDILREDSAPTEDETMQFQLAWIDAATRDASTLDHERFPAIVTLEVRHTDGRCVYALYLTAGYDLLRITRRFCGFFASRSDMFAFLDRKGIPLQFIYRPS